MNEERCAGCKSVANACAATSYPSGFSSNRRVRNGDPSRSSRLVVSYTSPRTMYHSVHTICRRVVANVVQHALLHPPLRCMALFGALFSGLCGPDVPRHTICLLAKSRVTTLIISARARCSMRIFVTDHSALLQRASFRFVKFYIWKYTRHASLHLSRMEDWISVLIYLKIHVE